MNKVITEAFIAYSTGTSTCPDHTPTRQELEAGIAMSGHLAELTQALAEEAMRLSVDLSARVTLSLEVAPSEQEGVGAFASSVSRMCQVHAGRIGVQACLR